MKAVKFIFPVLLFVFSQTITARAQSGSEIRFYLLHKNGRKINLSRVIAGGTSNDKDALDLTYEIEIEESESDKELKLKGERATGNEFVALVYKGETMKIRFRFFGSVGTVRGKIVFQKGSFIAEPQKPYSAERFEGIKIRRATKEEAKAFYII